MSFDKINISYLFNEKGLYLLLTIGVFLLLYLFLILVKKKIKKTKLYEIIFINAFLDAIDGWIFTLTLNVFLLYVFSFIFVNPKLLKVFVVILILVVGLILSKFLGRLIYSYTSNIDKTISTSIIVNLIRIIFFIILILVLLDYIGISITPILTSLGIAGLAISLALQSTLSNLFAGLQIIANKQIKVGDYIQLKDGFEGYVEDIKWHSTVIRELSNNIIIIPNSVLTNTIVKNFNIPSPDLNVIIKIGVSYDSDLEFVEKITIDIAKKVIKDLGEEIENFQPFIRYNNFNDFSIDFNLVVKIKQYTNKFIVIHELIKNIHKEYKKHNIVIPYPIRTVILENKQS
ncbi:MAG: mechanosensitive ion channel family protein [bacterium]|nr:mechanosensitive ion channel family protein [bacterium]